MPILATEYQAGLGGGEPDRVLPGTGNSSPPGIDAVYRYNDLVFNDRKVLDRYIVVEVGGFGLPELRDSREVNPGDHGETPFDAFWGGRTITMTGKIRAHNRNKLRDMEQAIRASFAGLKERPLIMHTGNPLYDVMINCRIVSLDKKEVQSDFRFDREFLLTLKASNPRILSFIRNLRQVNGAGDTGGGGGGGTEPEPDRISNIIMQPSFETVIDRWQASASNTIINLVKNPKLSSDAAGWITRLTEGSTGGGGGTVPGGATPTFVDSFESGNFNSWNSQPTVSGGTISIPNPPPVTPYAGSRLCRAAITGGGTNYARVQQVVNFTNGSEWWFGLAFYLPSGFAAAQEVEIALCRWDSFYEGQPSHRVGGLFINRNPLRLTMQRQKTGVEAVQVVSQTVALQENRWYWAECRQKFHYTDGQAINEFWVDGKLIGSSTVKNSYLNEGDISAITRIRYGIVASESYQDPISLYIDRCYYSNNGQYGPLGAGTGGGTGTPANIFNQANFEGATVGEEFTDTSLTGAASALSLSTTRFYQGAKSAYAFISDPDAFARCQWNISYNEGADLYFGMAVYLPTNFYTNQQNENSLLRFDNFGSTLYNSNNATFSTLGLAINSATDQLYLSLQRQGGTVNTLVTGSVLSTGTWHWIEARCKLDDTNGSAANQLWINGVSQGTSTTANMFSDMVTGGGWTRLRCGLVSSGSSQTNDLEIWFDRVRLADNYIGPSTASTITDLGSGRAAIPDSIGGFGYRIYARNEDSNATRTMEVTNSSGTSNYFPVTVGQTYAYQAELWIFNNTRMVPDRFHVRTEWFNSSGTKLSEEEKYHDNPPLSTVGRATFRGVTAAAPSNAAFARISIGARTNVAGDILDFYVTKILFAASSITMEFFDGDDTWAVWTGTANASTSQTQTYRQQDSTWFKNGTKSMLYAGVVNDGQPDFIEIANITDTPVNGGEPIGFSIKCNLSNRPNSGIRAELQFFGPDGVTEVTPSIIGTTNTGTGEQTLTCFGTVPTDASYCRPRIRLLAGSNVVDFMKIYFDSAIVVNSPLISAAPDYFDGDFADAGWDGTAHNSTSTRIIITSDSGTSAPTPSSTSGRLAVSVSNRGNFDAQPLIVLTGPMAQPTVTNLTTGESFSLSNTIAAGDEISFDMEKRQITNKAGDNMFQYLNDDAEYINIPYGESIIEVTFNSGTVDSQISVYWRDTWL